jgi:oligosaccharide repeat unit polymerase
MSQNQSQLVRPAVFTLWWLHPAWVFAVVSGGTIGAANLLSESAYRAYGTGKFIDGEFVVLAFLGIAAFVAGQWLGKTTGAAPRPCRQDVRPRLANWYWVTIALSLLGYLVWFGGGALRSGSLELVKTIWTLDENEAPEIRSEIFPTTPGVTTCTQFGMAAVMLGLLSGIGRRGVIIRRWLLGLLLFLAVLRMLLISERLALIELAVPAVLLSLRLMLLTRENPSPRAVRRLAWAPVAGLVGIVVLFGSAEYFRSWRFYQDRFDSVADFTLWRLSGYYTTGHNNSAMAMKTRGPWPMPYYTFEPFWRFPLVAGSSLSYSAVNGFDPEEVHRATLTRYGTPELNNPGGLFSPALDFGWVGYVIFWGLYGFIAGRLHRGFLAGSLSGLLFYPLILMSLLEVPRLLLLCSVRSFPSLALLGAVVSTETWRQWRIAEPMVERSRVRGATS